MIHPIESIKAARARAFGMGVGQGGSIRALRKQFGNEIKAASKSFNDKSSSIYAAARDARDAAGFKGDIKSFLQTEAGEGYKNQLTSLHNYIFADSDTTRTKLFNALDDYKSMYGEQYHARIGKDILGIAQSDYGSMIDEARTTRSGFTVEQDGKLYEYQMNENVDVRRSRSNALYGTDTEDAISDPDIRYKRRLLTTSSDGKVTTRGNWETQVDGAKIDKKAYDAARALSGAEDVKFDPKTGATVASDVEGATSTWITHTNKSVKAPESSNVNLNTGATRKAYKQVYTDSYEQEAARIARTGAGENSGIFKQLGDAAAAHPLAAAAIAVGGFALASKALDKRREYD